MGQGQHIVSGEEPEAKCINKQERKLLKKFKNTKCYSSRDELSLMFIYVYGFKVQPSAELFLKRVVTDNLKVLYRKKAGFPISYGIIFNQEQKVVGNTEESNVFCYYESLLTGSPYKIEKELLDYKLRELPDKLFRVDATPGDLYFSEKGRELKALLFDKDYKMKVLKIEEFIQCCWEQSFPKKVLEIHYPK